MSRQDYFTNDTRPITVNLETDGVAATIDVGATVSVAFVQGPTMIAGPWVASSGASGANWASGVVVVTPSGVVTPGLCDIEVEVVDGGTRWTRRTVGKPVRVVDDAI